MTDPTDLPWTPSFPDHPGSMHRQSTWRERALDWTVPLPLWQRLTFLAYANHMRNCHATFAPGELLSELKAGREQLYRALADAKKYGYLDQRSTLRCLIVPAASTYGGKGDWGAPCAYCEGKKARKVTRK